MKNMPHREAFFFFLSSVLNSLSINLNKGVVYCKLNVSTFFPGETLTQKNNVAQLRLLFNYPKRDFRSH